MKEPIVIQNITADPTCLVFRGTTNKEGTEGTLDIWSLADVQPGTVIKSNYKLGFRMSETNPERMHFKEFEVTEVLERRDLNGQWDIDREKKNHQSAFKVTVIPYVKPIGA